MNILCQYLIPYLLSSPAVLKWKVTICLLSASQWLTPQVHLCQAPLRPVERPPVVPCVDARKVGRERSEVCWKPRPPKDVGRVAWSQKASSNLMLQIHWIKCFSHNSIEGIKFISKLVIEVGTKALGLQNNFVREKPYAWTSDRRTFKWGSALILAMSWGCTAS